MDNDKTNNRTLDLPIKGDKKEIEYTQSVILIGANGSGKTKLGIWIEQCPGNNTRVAAHKILSMPDSSNIVSVELAALQLGHFDKGHNRFLHLYGNNPSVTVVNDFDRLMNLLHSEHSAVSIKCRNELRNGHHSTISSDSKIEQVQNLWEKLLPHRKLKIESGVIKVLVENKEMSEPLVYNPSAMSDGERMMFYVIGKCLTAPKGIIIIDEPELHIHNSLKADLYTEIEKLRPECSFVYLTHDLDFALLKSEAKKIWVKSYDGNNEWDWREIQSTDNIPEELLVTILGSRKNVVLVEGTNNSLDVALYTHILNDFSIIPYGGCDEIIRAVKAFKNQETYQLYNHVKVFGIIDRDRRTEEEIKDLKENNVYVLEVAEVENLFCVEGIIKLICEAHEKNYKDVIQELFSCLQEELSTQVKERTKQEINSELKLLTLDKLEKKEEDVTGNLSYFFNINYTDRYKANEEHFKKVISTKDYSELLKFYNRKNLASRISEKCGLAKNTLPKHVIYLMKGNHKEEIINLIKPYFGALVYELMKKVN